MSINGSDLYWGRNNQIWLIELTGTDWINFPHESLTVLLCLLACKPRKNWRDLSKTCPRTRIVYFTSCATQQFSLTEFILFFFYKSALRLFIRMVLNCWRFHLDPVSMWGSTMDPWPDKSSALLALWLQEHIVISACMWNFFLCDPKE